MSIQSPLDFRLTLNQRKTMLISEMIFELQEKFDKLGDVDVCICEDVEYVHTHVSAGELTEEVNEHIDSTYLVLSH